MALAYLDDENALVEAAVTVSELTHFDTEAGDACLLWCLAIRHAVLTGVIDVRVGLDHLADVRRDEWIARLDAAETGRPADFPNNGWVVAALQAAWSAISTTPVPTDDPAAGIFRADHLRLALDAAVRCGNDTDTVAAIAGGLLGAAYFSYPGLRNSRHGQLHREGRTVRTDRTALADRVLVAPRSSPAGPRVTTDEKADERR